MNREIGKKTGESKKRVNYIRDLLRRYCMMTQWLGFDYICDMVDYACTGADMAAMKLYKMVAEKYDRTVMSVERACREAIARAWLFAYDEMLDDLSMRTRHTKKYRPSVFEFVLEVAAYVQRNM